MRMGRRTIGQLCEEVLQKLRELGFADWTVMHYGEMMRRFERYGEEAGEAYWSQGLSDRFVADVFGYDGTGGPSQYVAVAMRACRMVGYFEQTGEIPGRVRAKPERVPPDATRHLLEAYMAECAGRGLSPETVRGRHDDACDFLWFLEGAGAAFPDGVDASVVDAFAAERHEAASGAMQRCLSSVRCFLRSLFAMGLSGGRDLSHMVPKASRYPTRPLTKVWSDEEVGALLASIPRGDAAGKRDYAVCLLLATYGMRAGDVVSLRMSDVDWDAGEITLVQRKTGVPNRLPLTDAAGWALADWLSNGRPARAACPEVFVRLKAPWTALGDVGPILSRRMAAAGVARDPSAKSGPHSLRHRVATALVSSGSTVPVVSSVLGHTVETTTMVYVHSDVEGLRRCALGEGVI